MSTRMGEGVSIKNIYVKSQFGDISHICIKMVARGNTMTFLGIFFKYIIKSLIKFCPSSDNIQARLIHYN